MTDPPTALESEGARALQSWKTRAWAAEAKLTVLREALIAAFSLDAWVDDRIDQHHTFERPHTSPAVKD